MVLAAPFSILGGFQKSVSIDGMLILPDHVFKNIGDTEHL